MAELPEYCCSAEANAIDGDFAESIRRVVAVEEAAKQRVAVEARQAKPDDATPAIDQGRDIAVADHTKVQVRHGDASVCSFLRKMAKPAPDIRRCGEGCLTLCPMRVADRHGDPAITLDSAKTIFIGDIVADEDRHAMLEGRVAHEGMNGGAFRMPGVMQFQGPCPKRDRQFVSGRGHDFHQPARQWPSGGGIRTVERDAEALVFDLDFREFMGDLDDPVPQRFGDHRRERPLDFASCRKAEFRPMLPGAGQSQGGKDAVQIDNRSAARQSDCTIQRLAKRSQVRRRIERCRDVRAVLADTQQHPIHIEKHGPGMM